MNRRNLLLSIAALPLLGLFGYRKPKGVRLSVIEGDPGYSLWMLHKLRGDHINVYLDGQEQYHCTIADSNLGMVRRCAGNWPPQIDPNNPDMVWEEDVYGRVVITVATKA